MIGRLHIARGGNAMSDQPPWWVRINTDPPILVKDIDHPNVDLLVDRLFAVQEAIGLGASADDIPNGLWCVMEAGDFNSAKVIPVTIRNG